MFWYMKSCKISVINHSIPKGSMRAEWQIVNARALEGLPHYNFGAYAGTVVVLGRRGLVYWGQP